MSKLNSTVVGTNSKETALAKWLKARDYVVKDVTKAVLTNEKTVALCEFRANIGKYILKTYQIRLVPTYEKVEEVSLKTGETYTKWVYEIVREG